MRHEVSIQFPDDVIFDQENKIVTIVDIHHEQIPMDALVLAIDGMPLKEHERSELYHSVEQALDRIALIRLMERGKIRVK